MRRPRLTAAAWWALALLHAVPGAVATTAPGTFATAIAGLPTDAPHYVRDVGVGELVLAALAGWAAASPGVRRPAAVVLALQLLLHALSHAVDGLGGAVVPSLVVQAVLLALAVRPEAGIDGVPPGRTPRSARGATAR